MGRAPHEGEILRELLLLDPSRLYDNGENRCRFANFFVCILDPACAVLCFTELSLVIVFGTEARCLEFAGKNEGALFFVVMRFKTRLVVDKVPQLLSKLQPVLSPRSYFQTQNLIFKTLQE